MHCIILNGDTMNLKKIINDYTECNTFEIKIKEGKLQIYYYDDVESFSSDKIIVKKENNIVEIFGDNLVIETMFKEFLVIKGTIKKVTLVQQDE